jgi:hypothetical protein
MRGGKKEFTHIEFDLEKESIPTPKENKKAIKQTLKNVLSKNQAKATLMEY